MMQSVLAMFERRTTAEIALGAVAGLSLQREQISLVRRDWAELRETPFDARAGLGGLHVLLAGVAPLVIPETGSVLAVGPLVDLLQRSPGGAPCSTGGPLRSALLFVGCSNGEASAFIEGVRRGGTLVIVHAGAERTLEVHGALHRACATEACIGIPAWMTPPARIMSALGAEPSGSWSIGSGTLVAGCR